MNEAISIDDAVKIIDAVIGEVNQPVFARHPMEGGDIALVLRKDGGCEILTLLPDNPEKINMSGIAMRGLFAVALFKLAHSPEQMLEAMQTVHAEINAGVIGSPIGYDA